MFLTLSTPYPCDIRIPMPSHRRFTLPLCAMVLAFLSFNDASATYERVQHASAHTRQATSLSVTLDQDPEPGNLLLLYFGARHGADVKMPDGWKIAWDLNKNQRFVVAFKKAADNEPPTITVGVSKERELVLLVEERYPAAEIDAIVANHSGGVAASRLSTGNTGELYTDPQHAIAAFMVQSDVWGGEQFSNGFEEGLRGGSGSISHPYIITAEKELASVDSTETSIALAGHQRMIGGMLTVIPGEIPILQAGSLRSVSRRAHSIDMQWSESTGGMPPRVSQLQMSLPGSDKWSDVSAASENAATATGLAEGASYDFRVRYEDANGSVVFSETVGAETSNVPVAIIEDDNGQIDGPIERMGPCFLGFLMTGSEFGAGDFANVKPEWNFGDESSAYNDLRGFAVGHFYDIEPDRPITKTVTLKVTNVDQEVDVVARKVVIVPNTRRKIYIDPDIGSPEPIDPSDPNDPFDTPANAWGALTGGDLEFVLTSGKTHVWDVCFDGNGSSNNIIVRSSISGVKANVAAKTDLLGGGSELGIRDIHFVPGGSMSPCRILDARHTSSTPGRNCWALDCTSEDPMIVAGITDHTSYFNLWQNVQTDDKTQINNLFAAGEGTIILGCQIRHEGDGSFAERAIRTNGDHVLVWDTTAIGHNQKNAFTRHGGDWLWVAKCRFTMDGGGGIPISLTHNSSGDAASTGRTVLEQSLITAPQGASNGILLSIGQRNQGTHGVVVRNVICDGGHISADLSESAYQILEGILIYNVTIVQGSSKRPLVDVRTVKHWGCTLQASLGIADAVMSSHPVFIKGGDDIALQQPMVRDNVMPLHEKGADIYAGTVAQPWQVWNTRKPSYGAGNRSKVVVLDQAYQPHDMEDPELIVGMPADMVNFQEDFYGNPRSPNLWYVGAVGISFWEPLQ